MKLAGPIGDRAFVFLRRRHDQRSRFLGVVKVKPRPTVGAVVKLFVRGKIESGRVAFVWPTYWDDNGGVTPTIHVTQEEPDLGKGRR